jgi:hypothetical protein
MLAPDAVRVEPKIERKPVDDRDSERRQPRLDLVGPLPGGYPARIVQQQQSVHRPRGVRRVDRGVAAPHRAAVDHRGLPFAVDLVAKTTKTVFLIHAFAEWRRERVQHLCRELQIRQSATGEGQGSRSLLLCLSGSVGDRCYLPQ